MKVEGAEMKPTLPKKPLKLACALLAAATVPAAAHAVPIPAAARASGAPAEEAGVITRDVAFGADLGRENDVSLVGIHSFGALGFSIPEHWEIVGDPELHLDVVRSGQLLPDVSAITIWVDGRPVGNVQLDGEPGAIDSSVVRFNVAGAANGYHQMSFLGYHRSRLPCELSDHPGLWSRVLESSFIRIRYRWKAPEMSLSRWPYPFRDDRDPDASRVVLLVPEELRQEEAQAAGYIASLLGHSAGWRPLDLYVHQGSLASAPVGHVVAITRADAPSSVLSDVSSALGGSETPEVQVAAQSLRDGRVPAAGLLAVVPRPGAMDHAMLAVVGRDGRGLVELGRLLSSEEARRLPSGPVEYVEEVKPYTPLEARRWRDTVPPEATFTVGQLLDRDDVTASVVEMDMQDRMVTGYHGGTISIPLHLVPDDHPIAGAARLELLYSYSAQADTEKSRIDVYLNGAAAGGVALRDIDGRNRQKLLLELPAHEMGPESRLDIAFTLVDKEDHRCLGDDRVEMWGTVHADSRITLPRDRWAYTPDLGLLRFGGYPLGLQADYGQTLFVLPERPDRTQLQLFAWLAAELGRVSRGDRFAYGLHMGAVGAATAKDRDLIVVDSGPSGDLIQQVGLLDKMSFTPKGPPGISLALASGGLLALGADPKVAYFEQMALPWDAARSAIVAYAADATLFERVGRCLDGDSLFDRLRGRVSRVASCADLAAIPAGERKLLGEKPVREQAYEPIRNNYWLLVAGIAIGIIFVLAVRGFWISLGRARGAEADDAGSPTT
jgi:hypothetical protein